jgi:hypothetical protein
LATSCFSALCNQLCTRFIAQAPGFCNCSFAGYSGPHGQSGSRHGARRTPGELLWVLRSFFLALCDGLVDPHATSCVFNGKTAQYGGGIYSGSDDPGLEKLHAEWKYSQPGRRGCRTSWIIEQTPQRPSETVGRDKSPALRPRRRSHVRKVNILDSVRINLVIVFRQQLLLIFRHFCVPLLPPDFAFYLAPDIFGVRL